MSKSSNILSFLALCKVFQDSLKDIGIDNLNDDLLKFKDFELEQQRIEKKVKIELLKDKSFIYRIN